MKRIEDDIKISVVSPVFNEEESIEEFVNEVCETVSSLGSEISYEHIILDNDSSDRTRELLRKLAAKDKRVKVVFNAKNYGVSQSGFHGLTLATGNPVIFIHSDFEDPIDLIPKMYEHWLDGSKVVICKRENNNSTSSLNLLRKLFYYLATRISRTQDITGYTGFGLIDRKILDVIIQVAPNFPFYRGLVAKHGYEFSTIPYKKPNRRYSKSKNTIFQIVKEAIYGLVGFSTAPLQLFSLVGLFVSILCFVSAGAYLLYKIFFWDSFDVGIAPIILGQSLLFGLNFIFLVILSQYIGLIASNIRREPYILDTERLNFHDDS